MDVVEIGGGTGSLAESLLREVGWLAPKCSEALRYRIVETSTILRQRQRTRLRGLPVEWGGLPRAIDGLVLSNELFDALPVHLVAIRDGQLVERYVDRGLKFVEGAPSTPRLAAYFRRVGVTLPDDYVTEVNLAATALIRRIGRSLRRGWVLTIDYGYPAPIRYGPDRSTGTLTAYHGGVFGYDPLVHVGEQDLTAHIDFTALARWGGDAGLQPFGLIAQRELLRNLGFDAYLHALDSRPLDLATYEWNREGMIAIAAPGNVGRFLALGQAKGDVTVLLEGFAPSERRADVIRDRDQLRLPLLGGAYSWPNKEQG
jgi:SAM-dependent MidA family methyltransferase